jgi:hypothetical protein
MRADEILESLKEKIFVHADHEITLFQEPYKGDFFKFFLDAYRNDYFSSSSHPRLTGDAIRDYFTERWLAENTAENNKRIKKLNSLLYVWDEWNYALEKVGFER